MKKISIFYCILITFVFIGCSDISDRNYKRVAKITFLSNRESPSNEFDIFLMNPDGSNQINATSDINQINTLSDPQLSPDGKYILFLNSNREKELQLLNIKSRKCTSLIKVNYNNSQAKFSPEGDKILFLTKKNNKRQISIINLKGLERVLLSNPKFDEYDPNFSSDGCKIVFVSKRNNNFSLCVMNMDGTERETLIKKKGKLSNPTFSPNSENIAFVNYVKKVPGLSIIGVDGTNLKNILSGKVIDANIYFTPDATQLIYNSRARGSRYNDICIINIEGKQFKNLTNSLNYINQNALLTPNGRSIIFNSAKFSGSEIYSVDIDGDNLINLTNHPGWDQCPSI